MMKMWKFRTKDGLECELMAPGAQRHVHLCEDMSERVYRLEAFHKPGMPGNREFVYVEECKRAPLSLVDDPAKLKAERDTALRDLAMARRALTYAGSSVSDWKGIADKLQEVNCEKQDRIAWLERELERLKPKKSGICK